MRARMPADARRPMVAAMEAPAPSRTITAHDDAGTAQIDKTLTIAGPEALAAPVAGIALVEASVVAHDRAAVTQAASRRAFPDAWRGDIASGRPLHAGPAAFSPLTAWTALSAAASFWLGLRDLYACGLGEGWGDGQRARSHEQGSQRAYACFHDVGHCRSLLRLHHQNVNVIRLSSFLFLIV